MRDRIPVVPGRLLRVLRVVRPGGLRKGTPHSIPLCGFLVFLVLPAILGLLGCTKENGAASHLIVASSTHPLGALVREICGPDAKILVLLSPGANPHSFEPTPRVVAEGSSASLVVRVGAGLDDWARPIVQEALNKGAPEIVAISLVDSLLPAVADEDEDAHDASGAIAPSSGGLSDPHVWLDPLSMIRFCREVTGALERLDPAHAATFRTRADATIDSLRALHVQLARILGPAKGASFVGTHNAWGYLCRRYGLRQVDVLQQVPTREPGPRRLADIIKDAAARGAKAVFTEVQGSSASAETLARELNLQVVQLDPEGTSDDPARDRYFDLLRWNARRITEALTAAEAGPRPAGVEQR
jgi:zinc transport system substrate-binding protein